MNRILACVFGLCVAVICCGCQSNTRLKVGRGQVTVHTEAHENRGFGVNTEECNNSVTLGFVTLGAGACLVERWEPELVHVGVSFGRTQPQQ